MSWATDNNKYNFYSTKGFLFNLKRVPKWSQQLKCLGKSFLLRVHSHITVDSIGCRLTSVRLDLFAPRVRIVIDHSLY